MPITVKDAPGIVPHGGALEIRMAGQDTPIAEHVEQAKSYPTIAATERRVLSDLELMAVGAVSPNRGFMTEADYASVVNEMHLANGLPWSLPITLPA
ncbi:MAG: sulfate adenylyltransferase, partial [Actinomycetota bacterium]